MARREKKPVHKVVMTEGKRNIIQQLLQEYDIETAEDIQDALKDLLGGTIEDIYGFETSEGFISDVTDKILPQIEDWQNRPLDEVYPIFCIDAIHYSVRDNGVIRKLAAYVILGINTEGKKEVLSITVGDNESSKYWLSVLNELKNRGVKDILIICADGLSGIKEAIAAAFPQTEYQRCIVHQVRNTLKYVPDKDRKAFASDLKTIYHNLYGNVFFVSDEKSVSSESYIEMLQETIPEQELLIESNPQALKRIEKKYIAEILKSGSSEIPKRREDQSEEFYVMMRKFGLILLRDIMEERDSLVHREFSDFLTVEDEQQIREKFNSSPTLPDDDINTSVDQTKRLINPKDKTKKKTEYLLQFENEAMHMFQAILGISEYLYCLRKLELMYDGKIPIMVQERVKWPKKIGRNELCPCGSGKKYKRCHGR